MRVSSQSIAKTKVDLIKICLSHHCRLEDNWSLSRFQEWFFALKAIVCILLGCEYKGAEREWLTVDPVIVGRHSFRTFYHPEFGKDASFVNVTVAHKWQVWRYSGMSDGWL